MICPSLATVRSDPETTANVARELLAALQPSEVLLIGSYNPTTYILDAELDSDANVDATQTIRYLKQQQQQQPPNANANASTQRLASLRGPVAALPFAPPNFLSGLDAALLTQSLFVPSRPSIAAVLVPSQVAQPHAPFYHPETAEARSGADARRLPPLPQSLAEALLYVLGDERPTTLRTGAKSFLDTIANAKNAAAKLGHARRAGGGRRPEHSETGDGNMYI